MANMDTYEALDQLRDELGAPYLLDELIAALSYEELTECVEWIARNNDIDLED